ncbi:hypothetical protein LOAG_02629, partial [Loa loa]
VKTKAVEVLHLPVNNSNIRTCKLNGYKILRMRHSKPKQIRRYPQNSSGGDDLAG